MTRVHLQLLFFSFLYWIWPALAWADNCGAPDDCFGTAQAATGVAAGIAATIGAALGFNWLPKRGDSPSSSNFDSSLENSNGAKKAARLADVKEAVEIAWDLAGGETSFVNRVWQKGFEKGISSVIESFVPISNPTNIAKGLSSWHFEVADQIVAALGGDDRAAENIEETVDSIGTKFSGGMFDKDGNYLWPWQRK
jgi:hypothetical protein